MFILLIKLSTNYCIDHLLILIGSKFSNRCSHQFRLRSLNINQLDRDYNYLVSLTSPEHILVVLPQLHISVLPPAF